MAVEFGLLETEIGDYFVTHVIDMGDGRGILSYYKDPDHTELVKSRKCDVGFGIDFNTGINLFFGSKTSCSEGYVRKQKDEDAFNEYYRK